MQETYTRGRLYNKELSTKYLRKIEAILFIVYKSFEQSLNMTTINWLHSSQNFRTNSTNYSTGHASGPDNLFTYQLFTRVTQTEPHYVVVKEKGLLSAFCASYVAHRLLAFTQAHTATNLQQIMSQIKPKQLHQTIESLRLYRMWGTTLGKLCRIKNPHMIVELFIH
jgi:hypothetical protein